MTNSLGWAIAIAAPGVLLWAFLVALLVILHRRDRLPTGAVTVIAIGGVAANLYPLLRVAGVPTSTWAWVPGVVVAAVLGGGYALDRAALHKAAHRAAWPEDPAVLDRREKRRRTTERYRAATARLNRNAGVDAPARDETETQ